MEHPIHSLMKTSMENLKEMVDVNTIVGDSVETKDGTIIIPVSRVGFGYGAGGSEFSNKTSKEAQPNPFGGGAAGGVSITPIAFLVVKDNNINLLHVNEDTHIYEKLIDLAPQLLTKIISKLDSSDTCSCDCHEDDDYNYESTNE